MSSLINNSFGTPSGHLKATIDDNASFSNAESAITGFDVSSSPNGKIPIWITYIHINSSIASKCAQEYLVATLLHEFGPTYLFELRQKAFNDEAVAINYVKIMATDLKTLYPAMDDATANAIAWGGLYTTPSGIQF